LIKEREVFSTRKAGKAVKPAAFLIQGRVLFVRCELLGGVVD
jgi:hypothetical protein